MKGELLYKVLNNITSFIYEHYQEYIQEAFESFWEGERPEDLLDGLMLEMGELNFEDWLTIDYKNPYGETLLDLYERYSELSDEESSVIKALRNSLISLYEVEEVDPSNSKVLLKDLLRDGLYEITSKTLLTLKKGNLFATRLIKVNGETLMGKCAYPFTQGMKPHVLKYIDMQYKRYLKNENANGNRETFLKSCSSVFNTLWLILIVGR